MQLWRLTSHKDLSFSSSSSDPFLRLLMGFDATTGTKVIVENAHLQQGYQIGHAHHLMLLLL
jgi:hypothetical protein